MTNIRMVLGGALASILMASAFAIVEPASAQDSSSAVHKDPAGGALEYKGTVAAALEGEVAPRIDGLLTAIKFKAGQYVNKGDLLFEFGARDKELSLALARAALEQAEAQLRLAEVSLKNAETLRSKNVSSEMQYLQTEAQRDIAAATAEQARANVQLAELALSQMKLFAPISGIVSRPYVKEGAYITKEARDQSRLATVAQLDPIHVVGKAPASAYFQRGDTITSIEQAAGQREFDLLLPTGDIYPHKGRFVAGNYEFDPATQTVEVTVEFPNPDLLLRPGLDVRLRSIIRGQ